MKSLLVLLLVLLFCVPGAAAAELPTLVRTPGAKPAQLIGLPLPATDGLCVDAQGRETPVARKSGGQKEFEDSGGEQSQGVGPDLSLRWRIKAAPDGPAYLYFLCRTGHQQGYEYVSPTMTYVVDVNGTPVPMEPVPDVAAVRTYQSPASWGHDMSWIRSRAKVPLKTGDAVTLGCTEKYAFVTRCLVVDENAHRLIQLVGRRVAADEGLKDADALLSRIAEAFPRAEVAQAAADARQLLGGVRAEATSLQDDIRDAGAAVERGEKPDTAALVGRAEALASATEGAETRIGERLRDPLREVAKGIDERLARLSPIPPTNFAGRQAAYHVGVARTYLSAASGAAGKAGSLAGLRRWATYLWRADHFTALAEGEKGEARPGMPLQAPAPARMEEAPRSEILLNGEWEIAPAGTPDAPPAEGWFPIRVPHGPWGETIGQFMALDRKWPDSKWAWYRVSFPVPADWSAGRVKLHFDAVIHLCEVYVNGRYCGRHIGGFDAFDVDVTGAMKPGQANDLLLFVHDTSVTALEKSDRPDEPKGCSSGPNHYKISDLWGRRFGGVWQDVALVREPAVRVEDVFAITSVRRKQFRVQTTLRNETDRAVSARLAQDVLDGGKVALSLPAREVRIPAGGTCRVERTVPWANARRWGIGGAWGDPKNLYVLRSRLAAGGAADTHFQRFGFRELWIEGGSFLLNGKRLPLQGGGNWYLQEGKLPHGNRWFGLHMYRSDRGMNVNLHRWHRHGDVAKEFFDLGDELGMLSEPEGAYWGVYGIPDILGYSDWDDPVWAANLAEHYRAWARKHRNHPSIALWSIENETFCATTRPGAMVDRFLAFGRALKEEDPTRPVTLHGSANGGYHDKRGDIEIVNFHYPSDQKVTDWRKEFGGRPCINGEFQSYPPAFLMAAPKAEDAARATETMCAYIEHWTSTYRKLGLAGALNFLPYFVGLFSTADRSLMGPWGDLLPDPSTLPAIEGEWMKGSISVNVPVPITWPSLSGPGIKCERLLTGSGNRSLINWFDPARPSITPNKAYEAYARCWDKMPALNPERAPEAIVTVTREGKPLAGATLIARPLDGQGASPFGVMTDPNGTGWLVFQAPGRYEIACGDSRLVFTARRLRTDSRPGYADVPRETLAVK